MTIPTADRRYFAVGLMGWVQIRVCTKPPKKVVSKGKFPATIVSMRPWRDPIEQKFKMDVAYTYYTGGRTVVTLKTRRFRALAGVSCRDGVCFELAPATFQSIIEAQS